MKSKKWCIIFIILFTIFALSHISITILVDPFFHYHKPNSDKFYILSIAAYQNAGIIKYFDYDGAIIGSSLVRNFSTSKAEELFDAKFIKLTYAATSHSDLAKYTSNIIKYNKDVKYIIRALDLHSITNEYFDKKNSEDNNLIMSLINDNQIMNEINYVFSKKIFFKFTYENIKGRYLNHSSYSFDEYTSNTDLEYGKEAVLKSYVRPKKNDKIYEMSNTLRQVINDKINNNIIKHIKENPDIQFYFFYPPYSILYWDVLYQTGNVTKRLEMEKLITEMLLGYENVKLYSFWLDESLITNLDNYKDRIHYNDIASTYILECIKNETNMLTYDNYKEYYKKVKEYFMNHNYDSYYE